MGALQHKLNMTYHGRTTLGCISYLGFELWERITPLYSAMSLAALWNMETARVLDVCNGSPAASRQS